MILGWKGPSFLCSKVHSMLKQLPSGKGLWKVTLQFLFLLAFGNSYLRLTYQKCGCCEKEDMNSISKFVHYITIKILLWSITFLSVLHLIPYCINIQMNSASEVIPAFFSLNLRIDEHFLSLSIRKLLMSPLALKWNSVILTLISKWAV